MKRKATTALVSTVLLAALAGGPSPAVAQAPTNEALGSFVGVTKIKVAKRIRFSLVCAADCNATVTSRIVGPRTKDTDTLSGSLAATVPAAVLLKPNGPLLRGLRAFPGRFKLTATLSVTNPATGEVDTDKRVFRFKR